MKRRIQDLINSSNYIFEEYLEDKENKFYTFYKEYDGIVLNKNVPNLNQNELTNVCFEKYSNLDKLGRCGQVTACIGREKFTTKKRAYIGHIIPSGWHSLKFNCIQGKYLYNRCHLIGHQLSGLDIDNNLITGTRYLNISQMLPFENAIAGYCRETGNHIIYQVTPIYKQDNLVASGVLLEALSVEDCGKEICFNIYLYNRQPGINIDYKKGYSKEIEFSFNNDII